MLTAHSWRHWNTEGATSAKGRSRCWMSELQKSCLKLNFTNEKDDSGLKMQKVDSPNISGFLPMLQLHLGYRQLASRNCFFHTLTSSSSFVDFNHSDQSQLLDRLKCTVSYLSLNLRLLKSIREITILLKRFRFDFQMKSKEKAIRFK